MLGLGLKALASALALKPKFLALQHAALALALPPKVLALALLFNL